MLTLPIKKKWFDMIKDGIKLEEYREIKPYYDSRFRKHFNQPFVGKVVYFRNGYAKNSPTLRCGCTLVKGKGNPEWGAEPNKLYYVLKILEVELLQE